MKTTASWAKALALALLSLCAARSEAKDKGGLTVTPVSQDADAANGGVVYALPKTVLRVKLTARAIVETAGPFYQYSTRLLNLTDVVTRNSVRWTIVAADVAAVGVPDYSLRFKVTAADGAAMPSFTLSPEGVLLALNADAAPAACEQAVADGAAEIRYADFSSVPLSQSTLSRTSKAAMAEDAAQSIYALRASRLGLMSGDKEASLPDVGSLREAMGRIDDMERQLVELFAGRRDTVVVTKVVNVIPDFDGENSVIPLRFSETEGFVDALDLAGKPVYVDFEFSDANKLNSLPEDSKARKARPLGGLRYIVPSCLTVRVLDRNILLIQKSMLCAQGGQVAELPAAMTSTHAIQLDPATGALRSASAIAK